MFLKLPIWAARLRRRYGGVWNRTLWGSGFCVGSLSGSDVPWRKPESQTPLPLLAARQDAEDMGGQDPEESHQGWGVGIGWLVAGCFCTVRAHHGSRFGTSRDLCVTPDRDGAHLYCYCRLTWDKVSPQWKVLWDQKCVTAQQESPRTWVTREEKDGQDLSRDGFLTHVC